MREYVIALKAGISFTIEFWRKKLALFAVNTGLKCGHGCLYCSTGCLMRMHPAFTRVGENPFAVGYAMVDPGTPDRVARDACQKRRRGMVQVCTIVDAWAPEAQKYKLGRQCLDAILSQPGWTVRVLTKNAAVLNDFDVISQYSSRILLGLSITATTDKSAITSIIEPNASSVSERLNVLKEAHKCGFRSYAMLCPLLPAVADSSDQIEELVGTAIEYGAEEIFVEPVNPRGAGLRLTQAALENNGYLHEAAAVEGIRKKEGWSQYVTHLVSNVQRSVRRLSDISRLRFLLYPSRLTEADKARIREDHAGVIWLGKD